MERVAQLVCAASESKQPRRGGRGKIEVLFSLPLSLSSNPSLFLSCSLLLFTSSLLAHIFSENHLNRSNDVPHLTSQNSEKKANEYIPMQYGTTYITQMTQQQPTDREKTTTNKRKPLALNAKISLSDPIYLS